MFLIVFVTLAISILGLFAQVVSLQAAQMSSSRNALAQNLQNWQNAAAAAVKANPPTNVTASGCNLNPVVANPSPVQCLSAAAHPVSVTDTLPPGPLPAIPLFSSIEYTASPTAGAAAIPYVLTYVSAATITSSGYNNAQIMRQLQRAPQTISFGTVTASGFLTVLPRGPITTTLTYTLPATIPIPVGSIGIISVAE